MTRGAVREVGGGAVLTCWDGRGAGLDELVVVWGERFGEERDCGEALGVDGGEAEGRAPDVELQDHGVRAPGVLLRSASVLSQFRPDTR